VDKNTLNKSIQKQVTTDPPIPTSESMHELVKILHYQPLYTIIFGHTAAVILVVVFLWNNVPHNTLLIWAGVLLAQSIFWVVLVNVYRRTKPPAEKAKYWARNFPIAGAFFGLTWGITAFWPNIIGDTSATIFLVIMVLGIVAAGLGVFAPYLRSYFALAICALAPFVVRFVMQDGELYITLAVMILMYMFAISLTGNNMRHAVKKSIELRLENIDLVKGLTKKNAQAEQAREEAELANLSKSRFLAAASHDLRQPMHALGLFVDALDSHISGTEERKILDNIVISTHALASLFNALLDISKLDAGAIQPKLANLSLPSLMQRLQKEYSIKAAEKGIELRVVNCAFQVNSDPAMLERIIRNLLSNAIRYTKTGRILFGCRSHGDQLTIEIYDTGVGISEKNIDKIYQEFYQVENPERDRRKGLGLGLAIVKRSCDLLGYVLQVSSIVNKGTVFCITLPRVANEKVIEQIDKDYIGDVMGAQVLIIDDEELIRTGTRGLLEQWGCKVCEAESSEQALKNLQDKKIEPHIILSDYRLREEKNGIEAINEVRLFFDKPIPAIIITGDTAGDRLREAKDSGFHVLHKPVSPAKLRSLISYFLENS